MNNQNKRIKRLIICVMFLNISSILFGAARIGRIENNLISDLSTESANEDISYESLWFDAIKLNSIELIEMLLVGSKVDINKCDFDGNTALHIAASEGYKDLIILLLKKGADLTAENNNKDKAINLAKKNRKFEIAEILFAKGTYGEVDSDKKEEKDNLVIKCVICNKDFSTKGSLVRHQKTHTGEKPFKCEFSGCDYTTFYKNHLIIHNRKHTGEKPFKCDFVDCDYASSNKSVLKLHKRKHTGEKPYKCDICNIGFFKNDNLVAHKRTHTGQRPFKCEVCNKTFSQKSHLNRHKKNHTDEKPYKCEVCNKAFSQNSNLVIHKRKHTGEKPYKCDSVGCDFAASHKSYLVVHKRKHLAEELFKMITDNRKDKVEELLAKGVDIDVKDKDGNTALHLAIRMSRKEILEILIEAGANIASLDRNGKTAENLAFDLGNSDFVSILQKAAKELAARQSANKE